MVLQLRKSLVVLGLSTVAAYAGHGWAAQGTAADVNEAVRTAVYDMTNRNSAEIDFSKNDATISDEQRGILKATLNAFTSDGKAKEILVLAYADKDYPKNQKESLSTSARQLADKRAEAVKKELDKLGAENIETYNMAEKPNWFEKKLTMSDAQIKNEAVEKPTRLSDEDAFYESLGRHVAKVGGPGKVIVVLRHDVATAH